MPGMSSKQPLYTALGWVTWTVGKRVIKKKLVGDKPRRGRRLRKAFVTLVVLGGAGAGAYAITQGSSSTSS